MNHTAIFKSRDSIRENHFNEERNQEGGEESREEDREEEVTGRALRWERENETHKGSGDGALFV